MYLPSHFAESDRAVLHRLMQDNPLSTLTTLTSSGLNADHIPLLLSPDEGAHGVLRGHVARANPVWRERLPESGALAIFQASDAYISPGWYSSKKENGKAVPTWNYAVVHAAGSLRIVDDIEWLRALLTRLTAHHEASMPKPWTLTDAPADYIDKMLGAVVGIEIEIASLTGKWKVSQNQPAQNHAGVVAGLRALGQPGADEMAALVASREKTE